MEAELALELKKSMRAYALKFFVVPTIGVSIMAFIIGFLISHPASQEATPAVPVGTILVYLGDMPDEPNGWLHCEGGDIPPGDAYNGLRQALSRAPGVPEGKLPDLRGVFVRGLDTRSPAQGGKDPDSTRNLGEFQSGKIRGHLHGYEGVPVTTGDDEGEDKQGKGSQRRVLQTSVVGGAETRPKNVAVSFVIKY